jgi:prepilin-type N-terminal cleavage/methylation domain
MGALHPNRRRGLGPAPRRRLPSNPDERGISLVELIVAITVMAIIMSGLALSLSVDYAAVALARTRGVAEAAANKRLEEFRDVDYASLALTSQPTKSADTTNPDSFVSSSGATYDVYGNNQTEDLIVAAGTGPVAHLESNVTIGTTVIDIYKYVTWVDVSSIPGAHNLKRLSIVVRYQTMPRGGATRFLRESVVLSPGTVSVGASAVTTTTTTTTTIPPVTTTTTLPATACGSFTVTGASPATAGFTGTTTVTLTMSLGSCGTSVIVNFSNDAGATWGADFAYSSTKTTTAWTLTDGDGLKTISARLRNGAAGSPKSLASKTITLDTVIPTTPVSFTRTASCSGTNRTVVLNWSTAFDTNLVGYRVYRSTDGVTYTLLSTVATLTASNKHSKSLTSVRFYVIAYDKTGNTSNATTTITLAQNQCS